MLVVINANYGAFEIPTEVGRKLQELGLLEERYNKYRAGLDIRTHDEFISWVRKNPESDLKIADVPDGYTDYRIEEYDGYENLLYVMDGKIHFARKVIE